MMPAVKVALQITALTFLLAINFAADAFGQSQPNRPDPARHAEENERDLEQRMWNLRMLSEEASKPRPKKPTPAQALEQLQKDFTQLQILNKSLLRAALGNTPLDPRFVSKSVTEIRERAERLNTNLALPSTGTRPATGHRTVNRSAATQTIGDQAGQVDLQLRRQSFLQRGFSGRHAIDQQSAARSRRHHRIEWTDQEGH